MIERYLLQSDMFIMKDKTSIIAEAVVSKIQNDSIEIKNIAVSKDHQGKGYGKKLINWICSYYKSNIEIKFITVGTSEFEQGFYKRCGFKYSHIIENFFLNNYPDPIIENGKQISHMYYLIKEI